MTYGSLGVEWWRQATERERATKRDFIKTVQLFREAQAKEHGYYPVADPERKIRDPKITPKEADLVVKAFDVFGESLAEISDPTKLNRPEAVRQDLLGFRLGIGQIKEIIALRDIAHHFKKGTFGVGYKSDTDPEFVDTVETLAFSKSFEELALQRYENKYLFVPEAGMIYGDLSSFAIELQTYAWAQRNIDGAWERMIKSVGRATLNVPSTLKNWAGKGWDGTKRFVDNVNDSMNLMNKLFRWSIYGAIGYGIYYVAKRR